MTKKFGKANNLPLLELYRSGRYLIGEVAEEREHMKRDGKKVRDEGVAVNKGHPKEHDPS